MFDTNKAKVNDMLNVFDALLPSTDILGEKDYAYLHGRLDSLKHMIIMFGRKDIKMLNKWQIMADKLSYKNYEYTMKPKTQEIQND